MKFGFSFCICEKGHRTVHTDFDPLDLSDVETDNLIDMLQAAINILKRIKKEEEHVFEV